MCIAYENECGMRTTIRNRGTEVIEHLESVFLIPAHFHRGVISRAKSWRKMSVTH